MPLICNKCRFLDKAATLTEEDYHNPENTKQMEDVHSNASGGGEMCFADDAYLVLHNSLFHCVHADGICFRGTRIDHEHPHRLFPHPSR